jgi:hypothetical protein
MSKDEIKACGIFGYELVEEVVTDATLHQFNCDGLQGTLCRTSSGIRLVIDGGIYLAVDNEKIDTVEWHPVSAIGCSPWKHFGFKALRFKIHGTPRRLSFLVSDSVAKSWAEHFDVS